MRQSRFLPRAILVAALPALAAPALAQLTSITVDCTGQMIQSAGATSPSVDAGFYLLLRPLKVGKHVIHFGGTFDEFNFSIDTTYIITVVHNDDDDADDNDD